MELESEEPLEEEPLEEELDEDEELDPELDDPDPEDPSTVDTVGPEEEYSVLDEEVEDRDTVDAVTCPTSTLTWAGCDVIVCWTVKGTACDPNPP